MGKLEGSVAIVTGGSKGIGKSIGALLAREGARVVLAARTAKDLDTAAGELTKEGLTAIGVRTDVAVSGDAARLVDRTIQEFGKIDVLVNNAGFGIFRPVAEMDVADFDAMWSVNVRGVFLVTKAALPHMVKQKSGTIVNIASLAGKNMLAGGAGYCATKWALRAFGGSLMLEVREHHIRVVTIFPGSVDTGFSSTRRRDGISQPGDVAEAVLFAATMPARSMVSEIDLRPTNPGK